MKWAYDLCGAQEIVRDIPVYGNAAAIIAGAGVMRGATPGTDQGFAILAASACADFWGVLQELHAAVAAGADSKQDGTAYTYRKAIINPFAVWRTQYDATDTMAVASTSTTTVTVTSLEDNIDGGWLLGDDGQLQYLVASASGSATSKTSSGWTSANTLLKILPVNHQLIKLNATADKLGTDAAAGSGVATVLENYIQARGIPLQKLNPTKHSGLTLTSPKVFSDIIFRNHTYNTID